MMVICDNHKESARYFESVDHRLGFKSNNIVFKPDMMEDLELQRVLNV